MTSEQEADLLLPAINTPIRATSEANPYVPKVLMLLLSLQTFSYLNLPKLENLPPSGHTPSLSISNLSKQRNRAVR